MIKLDDLPPLHSDAFNTEGGIPASTPITVASALMGDNPPAVGNLHAGTHPGVESRGAAEGGRDVVLS